MLFAGEPQATDETALDYHDHLYREWTQDLCENVGIAYDYANYDCLGVKLPRFVDPNAPIPESFEVETWRGQGSQMISLLNQYLALPAPVVDNKSHRRVIERIFTMNGINNRNVFWIVAGYLAFDYRIRDLVGGNEGIYLVSERFDPLFSTAKLTPALDSMNRVELRA